MGLFEAIIRALIFIGCCVLAYFIVLWALSGFGILIPGNILHVIQIIFGLFAILILVRLFYPFWNSGPWFGPGNPNDPNRRF